MNLSKMFLLISKFSPMSESREMESQKIQNLQYSIWQSDWFDLIRTYALIYHFVYALLFVFTSVYQIITPPLTPNALPNAFDARNAPLGENKTWWTGTETSMSPITNPLIIQNKTRNLVQNKEEEYRTKRIQMREWKRQICQRLTVQLMMFLQTHLLQSSFYQLCFHSETNPNFGNCCIVTKSFWDSADQWTKSAVRQSNRRLIPEILLLCLNLITLIQPSPEQEANNSNFSFHTTQRTVSLHIENQMLEMLIEIKYDVNLLIVVFTSCARTNIFITIPSVYSLSISRISISPLS